MIHNGSSKWVRNSFLWKLKKAEVETVKPEYAVAQVQIDLEPPQAHREKQTMPFPTWKLSSTTPCDVFSST